MLDAFARPGGWMYYRATDLIRLVDDKPAACKAVVSAIKIDGVEWWRALGAFNSLGAPCAESAPAVLDVILAMYGKGTIDDPAAVRFFAERFELTPALRKRAAAALRAVRKKTPAWQRKGVDEAAAAFAKPWAPPAP